MDYPKMDYHKKILFQMSGMLGSCDYILTLHGGFVQGYCFKIGPYSSNKGGGSFDGLPYTVSQNHKNSHIIIAQASQEYYCSHSTLHFCSVVVGISCCPIALSSFPFLFHFDTLRKKQED